MLDTNILELPQEILQKIFSHFHRKSCLNLACASQKCKKLIEYKLFQNISLKWCQLQKCQMTPSLGILKNAKSISIKECPGHASGDWEGLSEKFELIMKSCDPLLLKQITLKDKSLLDKDLIPVFKKFINLEMISLDGCKELTSCTFHCLTNLKHLFMLNLSNCHLPDNHLPPDLGQLQSVHSLSIDKCTGVSSATLNQISKMPCLKILILRKNYQTGTSVLVPLSILELKDIDPLKFLDLSYSYIANEGDMVALVSSLKSLTFLNISSIKVRSSFENICASLPLLQSLVMSKCDIFDRDLTYIQNLKRLRLLNIKGNRITDDGLSIINQLVPLEILDLSSNEQITDVGLKHLNALVSLKSINIANCFNLGDGCLIYLSVLPSLMQIGIGVDSSFSQVALNQMKLFKKDWSYTYSKNLEGLRGPKKSRTNLNNLNNY